MLGCCVVGVRGSGRRGLGWEVNKGQAQQQKPSAHARWKTHECVAPVAMLETHLARLGHPVRAVERQKHRRPRAAHVARVIAARRVVVAAARAVFVIGAAVLSLSRAGRKGGWVGKVRGLGVSGGAHDQSRPRDERTKRVHTH